MALLADVPIEEACKLPDELERSMFAQKLRFLGWIAGGGAMIIDRDEPSGPGEFRPRVGQLEVIEKWLEQAKNHKPVRTIIPKHRRHGISTVIQLDRVHTVLTEDFIECVSVAQKGQAARNIFKIARIAYKEAKRPEGVRGSYKSDDVSTWSIVNQETGSSYECMTGLGAFTGSGSTIHRLHVSEFAKFETGSEQDAQAIESLENAVASTSPNSQIDIESSGQGPFGVFPDRCRQAADGKGMYALIFIPWWRDSALQLDEDGLPDEFEPALAGDEISLRDVYKCSDSQLAWRRLYLDTKFRGVPYDQTPARFAWDFPTKLEDCFSYQEGRVFPDFSRQKHHGKLDASVFGKKSYKTRFLDWGGSQHHPFVCIWCWIDPEKPARLIVDTEQCPNFTDQMIAYRRNPKTYVPVRMNDDGPAALRYGVATLNLNCLVYVYRELYITDPSEAIHTRVARKIHQMSGWVHPSGDPNDPDISLYRPVAGADEFKAMAELDSRFDWKAVWPEADPVFQAALRMGAGVADCAQYRNCLEFTKWGIPLIPNLKPKHGTSQGQVEDEISMVQVLVMSDTEIRKKETEEQKVRRLAFEGQDAIRDGFMPSEEEDLAMKRFFGVRNYVDTETQSQLGSGWEAIVCDAD